jgi:S-adenosylmethionine:tRNA ribosyltransferase-isomerase
VSAFLAVSDFDYDYPEELIASAPAEPRDSSRLLVLDRASGAVEHAVFRDLPRFLKAGPPWPPGSRRARSSSSTAA